ncbi:hypothetical protein CAPTEDRAFT_194153 [Capitella teleta]|uniref:Uncharacterized protein n=1 Tax=Capitella teleta TaxID=283909 RepID=R7TJZ3_CAPTE|nr:hypothetical protein CAPTEDRAFT_194153 [Capitella teleta]|eukprot:ELT91841.1 hypothetical protein CAPTEDRAFT_194153 [Capitella teleta]
MVAATAFVFLAFLRETVLRMTSIDIHNTEQLNQFTCSVVGRPTREAIQYMDNAGILEALTRRAYDNGLIVVGDFVQEWEEMALKARHSWSFFLPELMSEAGSSGNGHDTYRKRSNEDVRAELHSLSIRLATEPELEAA